MSLLNIRLYHYSLWDTGWGCVYRNAQTLLGVLNDRGIVEEVPDLQTLGKWTGKEEFFQYSIEEFKEKANLLKLFDLWIEPHDICNILHTQYQIKCTEILANIKSHAISSEKFKTSTDIYKLKGNAIITDQNTLLSILKKHFEEDNTPIISDDGILSFAILKMGTNDLIYADPHSTTETKIITVPIVYFFRHPQMLLLTNLNK